MPILLNGDTGITTPGLTNTGSTTLVNLTTTGNTILGDQSTDTLNVANGNLVLNSSGNLGIGTASPIGVANYQGITIGGTTGGLIRFQSGASTQNAQIAANTSGLEIECVNTGIPIKFYTGGSLRATLDSSGSLGLGTASPAYRLQVAGTASQVVEFTSNATATAVRIDNTNASGWGGNLAFYSNGTGAGFVGTIGSLIGSTAQDITMWATSGNGVRFYTNGNNERMRVTSAGNVGIGTTSPSSILTLSQAQAPITTFWGSARADGNPYTAGGIESTFVTRDGVPALGAFIRILDVNTFGAFPTTIRGGAITFGTVDGLSGQGVNATERARIDSSGNFHIGTTTTAGKLSVGGKIRTLSGDIELDSGQVTTNSTANPLRLGVDGVERARINSAGDLGIGTASPGARLETYQSAGGTNAIRMNTNFGSGNYVDLNPSVAGVSNNGFSISLNGVIRQVIDGSGNLIVGKTAADVAVNGWSLSPNGGGQTVTISNTNEAFTWNNTSTAGTAQLDFRTANVEKGNISWNNSSTTYNTASDYRLKENIMPMTGALARVAQLKPVTYTWKADGSNGEGFIAHELAEVAPQAVTGEKDAVREDGVTPRYQGIDTSFLVATLTAAIQELKSELDSVKTELAALKGN